MASEAGEEEASIESSWAETHRLLQLPLHLLLHSRPLLLQPVGLEPRPSTIWPCTPVDRPAGVRDCFRRTKAGLRGRLEPGRGDSVAHRRLEPGRGDLAGRLVGR